VADDPYAIDAAYYDLIHEGFSEDVGLWLSFAGRTERPMLEVGCGSGRIAVPLALAGHDVTGVDPSPAMIARARARAEAEGADLTLIEGRVEDLALELERYGFILVPFDTFLYCEDGESQVRLLEALAGAMHFNATLALDLPGPLAWLDAATNGQPLLAWSGPAPGGGTLDVWHVHEDNLAAQTRWLRVNYETTADDGSVRRQLSEHRLRYVYPAESEYLLRLAGLRLSACYGDYDLGPLTGASERMIVLARRERG
jgi:SAM-dependent methyltransferase